MRLARLLAAALPCLLLAAPADAAFDAGRVGWRQLDFAASKFLLSATAGVEARIVASEDVAPPLLATPRGTPVAAGPAVLELRYVAHGLGRESTTRTWVDPGSGGTLQSLQIDGGSRQRQRWYRYTDEGAYHYTRWPVGDEEARASPERWSRREEGLRPFPAAARGKPVGDATALLWLAAASGIERSGERFEALTFSRRHVNAVTVEVVGRREVAVDYAVRDVTRDAGREAAATRRERGRVQALHLRVRGRPLDPAAGEADFELLGLQGDLDLLLDPRTRAPLELRGRVKVAGALTVRLRQLVPRDAGTRVP